MRKRCHLYILRYVPDLVRGERLNLGVFLHCPGANYLGCLLTSDFRRVKRFHIHADLGLLRLLQEQFEDEIRDHQESLEEYIHGLHHTLSNLLQISDPQELPLEDPQRELRTVFERYVGGPAEAEVEEDSRRYIRQRMTEAFIEAGILARLERRIPAARYTVPGDPLRFDYGYRPNGGMNFLHAISLNRDPDLAKSLAYTIEHVRRSGPAKLTAVVGALEGIRPKGVMDAARSILQTSDIQVESIENIHAVASSIRRDLGV